MPVTFGDVSKCLGNNPAEKLLRMINKQLLGEQKQKAVVDVQLEPGTVSLGLFSTKLCIKNGEKIRKGKRNSILIDVFKHSDDSWNGHVKNVLGLYNMNSFYENKHPHRMHFHVRSKITKFRLSNHNLSIQTGRHNQISKYERFHPFCGIVVKNISSL